MECEHAYTKPGVRFILCRKCAAESTDSHANAAALARNDRREEAHALCGHQRFCPNKRACTLLPSWKDCVKRREGTDCHAPQGVARNDRGAETREEAAETKIPAKPSKRKATKKSAEKSE